MVIDMLAERVVAPLVPCTWNDAVPVVAVPVVDTVSVLLADPFAGGVTDAGLNEQEAPDGSELLHARLTALAKPLVDETVQVLVALWPCVAVSADGLQDTAKSGLADATGVAVTHVLARPKQAEDAPAATTL
jgi:hypothetical protein